MNWDPRVGCGSSRASRIQCSASMEKSLNRGGSWAGRSFSILGQCTPPQCPAPTCSHTAFGAAVQSSSHVPAHTPSHGGSKSQCTKNGPEGGPPALYGALDSLLVPGPNPPSTGGCLGGSIRRIWRQDGFRTLRLTAGGSKLRNDYCPQAGVARTIFLRPYRASHFFRDFFLPQEWLGRIVHGNFLGRKFCHKALIIPLYNGVRHDRA